jgi:hypothetical protein
MSGGPPNSLPQPNDQPAQKPPAPPPTGRQPPPMDADHLTDERKAGSKSAGVARTDRQPDKPAVGGPDGGAGANSARQPTAPAKAPAGPGQAATAVRQPVPGIAREPARADAAGPKGERTTLPPATGENRAPAEAKTATAEATAAPAEGKAAPKGHGQTPRNWTGPTTPGGKPAPSKPTGDYDVPTHRLVRWQGEPAPPEGSKSGGTSESDQKRAQRVGERDGPPGHEWDAGHDKPASQTPPGEIPYLRAQGRSENRSGGRGIADENKIRRQDPSHKDPASPNYTRPKAREPKPATPEQRTPEPHPPGAPKGPGGPGATYRATELGVTAGRGEEVQPIDNPALAGQAKGQAVAGGVALGFAALNAIAGAVQQSDVKAAWNAQKDAVSKELTAEPSLGVMVVYRWSQVEAPWFSLNKPSPHFEGIELFYAETPDEARSQERQQGVLWPGGTENRHWSDRLWIEPAAPGSKAP